MTAEELKAKIGFTVLTEAYGNIVVTGGLKLHAEIPISKHTSNKDEAIMFAKDEIAKMILRNLYDDQRHELCEALDEFMQWHHPMHGDFNRAAAAQERLLKAARYQPSLPPRRGGKVRR